MNINGELNLVIGPMYSGKSTELLRIYNKFKRNYKILVINHASDNRYGNNSVNTHNKDSIDSVSTDELCSIEGSKNNILFSILLTFVPSYNLVKPSHVLREKTAP